MSKVIKLVSLFVYTGEDDNIRINTVYDLLKQSNDLELITTDFNHRTKKKHSIEKSSRNLTMLHVPFYKRNLSVMRFFSHAVFAYKLYRYLSRLEIKPDVVYCIVPTISSGFACALYCQKNKLKLAIDVIDLWPESLIALLPLNKIFSLIFYPWKKFAQNVYASADILLAESFEYAKVAQEFNKKTKALPIYLGTDVERYQKLYQKSKLEILKPEDEIWICYGGGLGNSYDFDVILNAFNEIVKINKYKIKLLFIGGGLKTHNIQNFINIHKLPAIITGFLPYCDFLKYLSFCDIALNSFHKNTKVVHSYKFNDYILTGLCILNNLKGETSDFIDKYEIGLNFDYESNLLQDKLVYLLENTEKINKMKANSIFVAENILNTKLIYKEMITEIEK